MSKEKESLDRLMTAASTYITDYTRLEASDDLERIKISARQLGLVVIRELKAMDCTEYEKLLGIVEKELHNV